MTTTLIAEPRSETNASVSERLASHVVGLRFDDLRSDVVEKAKDLLIYDLSLVFAGRFTDEGKAAVALAHELSGGATTSTIVGHQRGAALLDAIFANSELMGDRDDIHLRTKLRVGRVAHPAAWVLGERERASGRELIAALVVAYDVAGALAQPLAMAGDYVRMPHKCAFAPFAPAAVAARLLRHDHPATAQTLARAAHYGMGTNEGFIDAFALGLMARNGVMASLLPGCVHQETLHAIESPYGLYAALFGGAPDGLDASLDTLGREFWILGAATPRFSPGSASHVAAIDAAIALVDGGLKVDDIARCVVVLPEEFRGRFGKRESIVESPTPRENDLVQSLRLRLAVLFVEGAFVARPTLAHLWDPAVCAAMAKIDLAFEPRPEEYGRLEVLMTSGCSLAREGVFTSPPRGDWPAWLRQDGEKFLSKARLAELERLLTHLEDVHDVGDILRCTIPDR
jgi:2-methylcitrate dehydratase PrpD